jgi:hypothetical protein
MAVSNWLRVAEEDYALAVNALMRSSSQNLKVNHYHNKTLHRTLLY